MSSLPSPPLATAKVVVVGAGVGGLSTALALSRQGFRDITVFEMAAQLGEVGAGINITPNLGRLLDLFGVWDVAKAEGVPLERVKVMKSKTDEVLSSVDMGYVEKDFDYPFLVVHRKSLQKALVVGCERSGVIKLRLGMTVKEVDLDRTRLRVAPTGNVEGEGEWIEADVLLAADGVKSQTRARMLARQGKRDEIVETGQAAYRILIDREQCLDDPELLPFFDGSVSYRWIGYRRHIIAYPIDSHRTFNMSTVHPDQSFAAVPSTSWTTRGSKEQMLNVFHDFCPRVQKLLKLVPEGEVCEWRLRVHQPLASWVDGRTALVGDACHPTLPHLAQGAAQAVEDAAVLGVVLSKIESKEDIHRALKVYERIRKARAEECVAQAAANGRDLHLADGDAQEARDKAFREASKDGGRNPDKAWDKETQVWLYAYDPERHASDRFAELWTALSSA